MDENYLIKIWGVIANQQKKYYTGYTSTQKLWVLDSNGKVLSFDEFKKKMKNPVNHERLWNAFHKTFNNFPQNKEIFISKIRGLDVNCLLNSALNINRGTEEGEYFKQYSNGDMMDLYANGQMSYLYSSNGKKVDGKWKCDGTNNFVVEMNDGQRYSSKDNKWTKIDSSGSSGTSGGSGTSGSGKSGTSGSGKSGTSGSGKSGTPTSNISIPYELKGSFTTPKSQPNAIEESINLKNVEKEVETILRKIYTDKINPKIRDIDFSVVDNGDSYTTNYNIFIDKSNDKKAWVGFKSFGAAGENYKNRADQNLDRGILSLDNKFGVELFGGRENTGIPFKVHFTQFRLPKQFPNHKVNESKIQKLIVDRLKDRFEEKKIQEDIVEKRLDYVISQLKETKNYKNINQYKRTKLFIEELKELESCGLL